MNDNRSDNSEIFVFEKKFKTQGDLSQAQIVHGKNRFFDRAPHPDVVHLINNNQRQMNAIGLPQYDQNAERRIHVVQF